MSATGCSASSIISPQIRLHTAFLYTMQVLHVRLPHQQHLQSLSLMTFYSGTSGGPSEGQVLIKEGNALSMLQREFPKEVKYASKPCYDGRSVTCSTLAHLSFKFWMCPGFLAGGGTRIGKGGGGLSPCNSAPTLGMSAGVVLSTLSSMQQYIGVARRSLHAHVLWLRVGLSLVSQI